MMFSCSVVSDCDPMGFPRQKFWSGLPFPSPGNPLDLGIRPGPPALAGRSYTQGLPRWHYGKEPACQCRRVRDLGSVSGSGRSPGGGHSYPLQYTCLKTPRTEEPGGLQSIRSQSRTRLKQLSTHACALIPKPKTWQEEKHGSILLWIPTVKPQKY